jgi:hypothetical protein
MFECIVYVDRPTDIHSNIHREPPEDEIIVHHWCIIMPSVSKKAARRCADDLKGQSVADPAPRNSSMSIGIIDIPLFGQLSGQSVDDFCGMSAESAIRSHHEGSLALDLGWTPFGACSPQI